MDVLLPASQSAPAAARAALAPLVRLDSQLARDGLLLVSELVTNSVRHATTDPGATVRMLARATPSRLHVEVEDSGPGFDASAVAAPARDAESGFGLLLVARIASRWGVKRGERTRTWFELDRSGRRRSAAGGA